MDYGKIKLSEIIPAEYNPRKISDDDYNKLSNSIAEFGFVDPIIINLRNNRIIGGHQRYDVLVEEYLGRDDELICVKLGDIGWVFPSDDLRIEDESHEKGLNIALNKISGQWDNEKLHNLLISLEMEDFDLDLTGFKEYELDKLKYDSDIEWAEELDAPKEEYDVEEDSSEYDVGNDCITCPFCEQHFREEDAL